LDLRTTIARLRDAGLDSIPGGGAEILDDEVRHRIARLKCNTEDWVSVHRTAHQLGMRTTATMMFGVGETFDQRVNHFEVVRRLQEETGGFTAFIPWSFQPKHTALGGRGWDEATSVEYLKTLAISRLYLDNIENVQASWVTQGLKVLELGLHFGGNDVGSVMLEENVVKAAGTSNCTTEEELRPHYSRCRIQACAAGHAVSDDVLELGSPERVRKEPNFMFPGQTSQSGFIPLVVAFMLHFGSDRDRPLCSRRRN